MNNNKIVQQGSLCPQNFHYLNISSMRRRMRCGGSLTGSWKKVVAVFVEGHGHDAVRQVKGFLYAIAMVDVDVDVENPRVVPESHGGRREEGEPSTANTRW